jgi:mRNA m6A methyltransferase non-catalytic subunit
MYVLILIRIKMIGPQTFDLKQIGNKFDVILVEPPLGAGWRWPDILALDLQHVAQARSFIFLWCGSSEGTQSDVQK